MVGLSSETRKYETRKSGEFRDEFTVEEVNCGFESIGGGRGEETRDRECQSERRNKPVP